MVLGEWENGLGIEPAEADSNTIRNITLDLRDYIFGWSTILSLAPQRGWPSQTVKTRTNNSTTKPNRPLHASAFNSTQHQHHNGRHNKHTHARTHTHLGKRKPTAHSGNNRRTIFPFFFILFSSPQDLLSTNVEYVSVSAFFSS